jgi:hypothetical protein
LIARRLSSDVIDGEREAREGAAEIESPGAMVDGRRPPRAREGLEGVVTGLETIEVMCRSSCEQRANTSQGQTAECTRAPSGAKILTWISKIRVPMSWIESDNSVKPDEITSKVSLLRLSAFLSALQPGAIL